MSNLSKKPLGPNKVMSGHAYERECSLGKMLTAAAYYKEDSLAKKVMTCLRNHMRAPINKEENSKNKGKYTFILRHFLPLIWLILCRKGSWSSSQSLPSPRLKFKVKLHTKRESIRIFTLTTVILKGRHGPCLMLQPRTD